MCGLYIKYVQKLFEQYSEMYGESLVLSLGDCSCKERRWHFENSDGKSLNITSQ